MSFKIGDIDLVDQSLNNEYRILNLEKLLNLIINKTKINISVQEIMTIRQESLREIQQKYPNNGITLKDNSKEDYNG